MDSLTPISLGALAALDPADTLVLTVNNRHARVILAGLSPRLRAGEQVTAIPRIVPVSAWLDEAGMALSFQPGCGLPRNRLDPFGAELLWRRVIEDLEQDEPLLDIAQAARLAMDADHLMGEWQLAVAPHEATPDYHRFETWRQSYLGHLEELDAEDGERGRQAVVQAIVRGEMPLDFRRVVIAGFAELSPRLSFILATLQEQGVQALRLEAASVPAPYIRRCVASDSESEWRNAARWARFCLDADPQGRYAIVAPSLESDAPFVRRVLGSCMGWPHAEGSQAFNITVGRPLSEWPLVRAALAWLALLAEFRDRGGSTPAVAGAALLAGGCIADDAEKSGRALLDALWRRRAVLRLGRSQFESGLAEFAPRLARAWQSAVAAVDDGARRRGLMLWAQSFRRALQGLGFPGRMPDSAAHQALEALEKLLHRLAGQALVAGEIDMAGAVGLLERLARETPFQPQRDPHARLDVLGLLEAEGGQWDGLFILGLTDDVLPAAPKPNALLPLSALRRAGAPRATVERELAWAHSLMQSLLACAPRVWCSHALFEGERVLRPSSFIAALPEEEEAPWADPPAEPVLQVQIERLVDERGPALAPGSPTRGGIAVLDTQARNPLWAFAKYRLGASALPDYAEISPGSARGLFLHRAVEIVWRMIGDQDHLHRLSESGGLHGIVEEAVALAASEHLQDSSPIVQSLETARAASVLAAALATELQRTPFTVDALEKELTWSRGALQLSVRLDRIDRLHDDRLALIDYKTGSGVLEPKKYWTRNPPIDLQLPFYSAVLPREQGRVATLVLMPLHARKREACGLTDGDYGFETGVAAPRAWNAMGDPDWEALLERWRRDMESLADAYCSGWAVNHSLHPDDIKYCDVLPFLRLYEDEAPMQEGGHG